MTEFVLNMTELVLNMTLVVLNMTEFDLNISGRLKKTASYPLLADKRLTPLPFPWQN